MIVFKNYFKILKSYKFIILIYTIILLSFTLFSSSTNHQITSFSAVKPDVAVVNLDGDTKLTEHLISYLSNHTNIKDLGTDEEKLEDGLFYQEVNAIIYIYDGYTDDFLQNHETNLEVKYTADYYASYTNMLLERYFKIADIVNDTVSDEDNMLEIMNQSLAKEIEIQIKSKLDTDGLSRASYFFSFSNYTILAICIYVTAIILNRFQDDKIKARNMVSSKRMDDITKELYLGNFVFVGIVWIALMLLSFIIIGSPMFTMNGVFLLLNSFFFMTCALSIGFVIGYLLKNTNAISAAVTIISLGTSFICGSFIPVEYLPNLVIQFSKFLPSYWFIHNNDLIKTIEVFNMDTILPLVQNMGIVVGFSILFFILAVCIAKRRRK